MVRAFRNLSFDEWFRDHNFSDFTGAELHPDGGINQCAYRWLESAIRESYQPGPFGHPDPEFSYIITLTLSPECCASFTRTTKLPINERDYYLSKIFQFIFLTLYIRFPDEPEWREVEERLVEFLQEDPGTDVQARFDWWSLYADTRKPEADVNKIVARLQKYLPTPKAPHPKHELGSRTSLLLKKKTMSVPEAAEVLECSGRTIRTKVETGQLQRADMGHSVHGKRTVVRILSSSVKKLLKARPSAKKL